MKKWTRCLSLALIFVSLFTLPVRAEEKTASLLCLNIGKADCMLLFWEDKTYLIDSGYWQTYSALETALSQYGVTHLNGVFLTHCHKDHEGGLYPLAQSDIQVDAWYAAAIYYDVKEGEHPMVLAAQSRGVEVTWLSAGDVIPCGESASFTVLGPLTVNYDNENNNSLVMRFSSPAGSILLTGDMKTEEEEELLSVHLLSPSDLLKAGHHGDNNATSRGLLQAVQPKAAVICTSTQEEPDTPADSTLKRLSSAGCAVNVTQDYSDAVLLSLKDGQVAAQDVKWQGVPERIQGLSLSIDLSDDTLTVTNTSSSAVTLTDCLLFSSKGEETLNLPEITLSPGQAFVIGTKSTEGETDYQWNDKKVWNKNKRDMAVLYDAWGRALARTDNGLEE